MTTIYQFLVHTPWWVFLLFFYLLKLGINATKTRIVHLGKIFILPIVFLILSIKSLTSLLQVTSLSLVTYISSILMGITGGWMLVRRLNLSFDHVHHLIKIPGSFMTLILIFIIFSSKYYFGYSIATKQDILQKTSFIISQLILSGFCTGLSLGRLACYLFQKSQSSHENLKGELQNG